MGSEAEEQEASSSVIELPLLTIPPLLQSPFHSGMLTPPLQTTASVPFRWEEEPGKPRPCTALINRTDIKCLELPPRLLLTEAMITKVPSPTTVLEGPYKSSSFRLMRDSNGSFGASGGGGSERWQLGAMVLSKRGGHNHKARGSSFRLSWGGRRASNGLKGKREIGEGSLVFTPTDDDDGGGHSHSSECGGASTRAKMTKIKRKGSFLGLSNARSHFLATVFGGLKQAIPWGSRKLKKNEISV